jgi:hypothetical protein
MGQPLEREQGERHHAVAALQVHAQRARMPHAGGDHLQHLGLPARLLEAHQVLHQRGVQRRELAVRRAAVGLALTFEFVQVGLECAGAHQLGLTQWKC